MKIASPRMMVTLTLCLVALACSEPSHPVTVPGVPRSRVKIRDPGGRQWYFNPKDGDQILFHFTASDCRHCQDQLARELVDKAPLNVRPVVLWVDGTAHLGEFSERVEQYMVTAMEARALGVDKIPATLLLNNRGKKSYLWIGPNTKRSKARFEELVSNEN